MKKASGIFLFNSENKFLVEHPTNHHPNFWSVPKGLIENGEDPFNAAKREMFEETSLNINTIQYEVVKELPTIVFRTKKKSVKLFVLRTNENLSDFPFNCTSMVTYLGKKKLDKPFPEVDDFKWVTIKEAYNLLHESQIKALKLIEKL